MTPRPGSHAASPSLVARLSAPALLLALLLAWGRNASAQWIPLTNGTPPARGYTAMAADATRQRIVLFGGSPDGSLAYDDTWCWWSDFAFWQQLTPPGPQPPARFVHGMASWSSGTNSQLVMFAGQGNSGILRDTWTWNGSNWFAAATSGPSARVLLAMAEEPTRQRVLMFGGFDGSALLADTWGWNGSNWTQLPVTGPSPRAAHAMAYDAARDRVVLFGGLDATGYVRDTWEWDGLQWTLASTNGPSARRDHALARRGNRIVLYGGIDPGNSNLADTWEWDGVSWTQTAAGCPAARGEHSMAADPATGGVLLYGGDGAVVYSDTWRYAGALIATNPANVIINAGQSASFSVAVNSGGTIPSYQWERNCGSGFQPIAGATSSTYAIATATTNDACLYRCVVGVLGCSATSQAAQLTVRPPCTPASYSVTIPSGLSLIANQVDTGGNTLNEVFPSGPPNAQIYKWNPVTCSYVLSTFDPVALVWVPNLTLNPGEGAWFSNPGAPFPHTYTGCAHTPVLPITLPTNCCILVSRQTNGPGNYGNIVGLPPTGGTKVYLYHGGFAVYTFDDVDLVWTPSDPQVNVGEAMWVCCPTCSFGLPCVPPKITLQPASQSVEVGCCATFTVAATGTLPLGYQWRFNGVNVAGATGTAYTVCPVVFANSGNYQVVVTNACGSATSQVATLTVVADTTPPVIHCPTNDLVVIGSSGTNVFFNVTATDCDTNVSVVCSPPSGALFPCGTNVVTCTATDSSGNHSTCAFRIIVQCACLNLSNEFACTNGPALPTYSFTFQNNSTVPVKYLFLFPATNCFSFAPDILTFNPPVLPGQTTNVSVTINLAAPCTSNLCFTVSAHDTNLVQCCALPHCVNFSCPAGLPKLTIVSSGGLITLSWTGTGILQSAPAVTGPWTDSPNQSNPQTFPATGAQFYFRLRQ